MTKRLIFIRHAQTDMSGTFCGHADPGVNVAGHQQIARLLNSLCDEKIDSIVSSDLLRARDTAEKIRKLFGLTVRVTPNLREISFGEWEGLNWETIEMKDPFYARRWLADHPRIPAPGGETFAVFQARVMNEVSHIVASENGNRIAVVTHAGVLRVVMERLLGYSNVEAWDATRSYCCAIHCSVQREIWSTEAIYSSESMKVCHVTTSESKKRSTHTNHS